jgi:hypothetical protein
MNLADAFGHEKCSFYPREETAMGKMFLSLGFWMTIILFIALGYAFRQAYGAECLNCGNPSSTVDSFASSEQGWHFENNLGANDVARSSRCAPNAAVRPNDPEFEQMANLQQGGPVYAPGFSITLGRRSPQVSLCPGPIEIPRH